VAESEAVNDIVAVDGEGLTPARVAAVARGGSPVELAAAAKGRLMRSRGVIEKILAQDRVVYGVTTGFGKFADVTVPEGERNALQKNIVMSHAGGVGPPLPRDAVRAMMLLRANSLAKGYSGVRVQVVQLLLDMLNRCLHPIVPAQGSVGASGDLVPLAHIALVMIGEGEAEYRDQVVGAAAALRRARLEPLTLTAKEGLALLNGTQYMAALGCLAVHDARELMKTAAVAAAMSFEALRGLPAAFDARIQEVRPHAGAKRCAAAMRRLLAGSDLLSHNPSGRVQDAYSLRCIPQVHGASLDALEYVERVLVTEINSATDNPLVFPDTGEVVSGGNFHGQPLALALDFLALAVSEMGSISERRVERLVNPALSGLPPFLTERGGLNSGLMIAQYTAAALVSENKVLGHPASVDSIPTSGNQEDHVSMGSIAARKARTVVDNVAWVLAAELLAAAQGLDFISHTPGRAIRKAYRLVREAVPHWDEDRVLYRDLHRVHELVVSGAVARQVERETGPLV